MDAAALANLRDARHADGFVRRRGRSFLAHLEDARVEDGDLASLRGSAECEELFR